MECCKKDNSLSVYDEELLSREERKASLLRSSSKKSGYMRRVCNYMSYIRDKLSNNK